MIVIKITIFFFSILMILSLFKINEGLTNCKTNNEYNTKLELRDNIKRINNIRAKVNNSKNPLNSILNRIKYWKKKIDETQKDSKEQSNELSSDPNINIEKPLPKPIL